MARCLCAPTTHQGSFRCRLHRTHPLATPPAQLAPLGSRETPVDRPCHMRVRDLPCQQLNFDRQTPSSSEPSSTSLARPASSSLLSFIPFLNHARPPPERRAVSSLAPPPSSQTTSKSLPSSTPIAPVRSSSHAAASAIMKQHLHHKHSKNHMIRSNTLPRSSAGYKIGPSRLSRMAPASANEVSVLKKVDCPIPNLPAHRALQLKTSYAVEPEARQSTAMEPSRSNLKVKSVVASVKQSELSCKIVGYKAGAFIVPPAIY